MWPDHNSDHNSKGSKKFATSNIISFVLYPCDQRTQWTRITDMLQLLCATLGLLLLRIANLTGHLIQVYGSFRLPEKHKAGPECTGESRALFLPLMSATSLQVTTTHSLSVLPISLCQEALSDNKSTSCLHPILLQTSPPISQDN